MTVETAYTRINSASELKKFCERAADSAYIAFDTEFVSENRYRPKLCLLQVATESEFAIIDTLSVEAVSPFWDLLVNGDHLTIAHAAREEFLFCFRACQQRPRNLFDIQLAAGMVGHEYPASYSNLVSKYLGESIDKGETRTDWMKRPLSKRQLDYALQDVLHLKPIHDSLSAELDRLNRTEWFHEEMLSLQDELESFETEPQWRRVSGISNLNRRSLAIVRELWIARDDEAQRVNRSPKRVLPDDLIVEMARRATSDSKRLKAIRGFQNRVHTSLLQPLCDAIDSALELPEDQLPTKMPRAKTMNLGLLGQLLNTALKMVCKNENIAAGIVGTAQDIRDLAAWHMKMAPSKPKPSLACGWRAEIIGQLIEDMLDGSVAIRVQDPTSNQPLVLERL